MTPFDDTTLATALAVLSGSLDDSSLDLGPSLAQLTVAVRSAVPSYCGLSITMVAGGVPVTIDASAEDPAVGRPAAGAVTSLVVPLAAISLGADGELVLFASVAGAFVDLAADLAFETATELIIFALDTRLGAQVPLPVGVGAFSIIHQAIGTLIDTGYTPEQARARLAQNAANDGHDLAAAAERIVTGDQPTP